LIKMLEDVIKTGNHGNIDLEFTDCNGKRVSYDYKAVPEFNEKGEILNVLVYARDITDLVEYRSEIQKMAFFDNLTGLPNRNLFTDRLKRKIADKSRRNFSLGVMYLDIDNFKKINDSFGHSVGDLLLQEAAARLSSCVRDCDTVSRFGGDEFVLLISEIQSSRSMAGIAEKILSQFNTPFLIEGFEVLISVSIGITVFPDDGFDFHDLLKFADSALYLAKSSGRNNYKFYSSELTIQIRNRIELESELRRSIARNELEIYYQPKINLQTGMLSGAEALLRWNHPTRGLISPVEFISIAEDSGMIIDIGAWVLQSVCRATYEWNTTLNQNLKVAVNLSVRQFTSGNLIDKLQAMLNTTGCDPRWIELEITESLMLEASDEIKQILDGLRAFGCTIAMDDFGTGYSSLSYLTSFPIDTVKLDRSFIHNIIHNTEKSIIINAITVMIRELGKTVVAEGVETIEQVEYLREIGCHMAQGYFYGKPMAKSDFDDFINKYIPEA